MYVYVGWIRLCCGVLSTITFTILALPAEPIFILRCGPLKAAIPIVLQLS
jgi:hypothetical protein